VPSSNVNFSLAVYIFFFSDGKDEVIVFTLFSVYIDHL